MLHGIHEIDSRSNAGITVTLSAHFGVTGEAEYCSVSVHTESEDFTISEIPLHIAADVYRHPYSYANRALHCGRLAA